MVPVRLLPSVCDQKSHAVRLTTICSQQIVVVSSNLTYAVAPTGLPLGSWVGWVVMKGCARPERSEQRNLLVR